VRREDQGLPSDVAVINHVLTIAAEFNKTAMVVFPVNAILDFPMITPAGLAAFLLPKVNAIFSKILKAWIEYLDSPKSTYVLNHSETGSLSPTALAAIQIDDFIHDSHAPHFGFKSDLPHFRRRPEGENLTCSIS
jgi:phosphatidylserine decarboxylase